MAKKQGKIKVSELEKLNQDLLDLRLKHASMALKETHKIRETKKDIARLKTKLNTQGEIND
jgi:ribosomal protein L29|tara:strand:- start:1420 stop:1602 length:183 start_codon:yes stop_codon:yes gene_type:complete